VAVDGASDGVPALARHRRRGMPDVVGSEGVVGPSGDSGSSPLLWVFRPDDGLLLLRSEIHSCGSRMTDALSPETGALNRLSASEQMVVVVVVVVAVGPFLPSFRETRRRVWLLPDGETKASVATPPRRRRLRHGFLMGMSLWVGVSIPPAANDG